VTTALLGIAIGIVMGLSGAGGGILAVPALIFVLGWPLAQAAPVALVAVSLAATIGAIEGLKRGLVRYRAAGLMAAAGVCLAPAGVLAATLAPESVLLLVFAAAMAVVSIRMFRGDDGPPAGSPGEVTLPLTINPSTGRLRWTRRTATALAAIGAAAGFLSGLLGVGGGFFIVPALRRFSDITMQGIVATSLAVIALVSAGAVAAASLHSHPPPFATAAPFALGAAAGMVAGRMGARFMKPAHMQRAFASVTAVVAIAVLVRAIQLA
jgi:uncharacterized membrane protein YfcA